MLGFRIMPSSITRCAQSCAKTVRRTSSVTCRHCSSVCSPHFGLDDGDQSGFLAQRGIASQRLRIGLDAAAAGNAIADGDHRPPLGKARAHLRIFLEAVAQSVEPFGYFLSEVSCHVLGASIDLYAGYDAGIGNGLDKRSAMLLPLADRLVEKDDATDTLTKTGRRDDQFAIGTPSLRGLRDPERGKPSVAGRRAFIHRQQALVIGDQGPGGADEVLRHHLGLPHFQLRISGKSSPCLSM